MKYEFHVGDYVETKDGQIGYIKDIIPTTKLEPIYLCCIMDSKDSVLYPIYSLDSCDPYYNMLLKKTFNCIGQYDLTKDDEGKIEFIDGVDTADPNDSSYIIDKINELVDSVNELKTDYEKHLRAHELTER